MSLIPKIRAAVISSLATVRTGLSTMLRDEYEIVHPDEDPDACVADIDEWPADLPLDRPVLALTESPAIARRLASADLSGWGAIHRDSDKEGVLAALRCVLKGQIVCESDWLPDSSQLVSIPAASLSPREQMVLQLIAQGLANKEIATKMGLSVHTVKFHVAALLEKLGAVSRTEAVTSGIRHGLIVL